MQNKKLTTNPHQGFSVRPWPSGAAASSRNAVLGRNVGKGKTLTRRHRRIIVSCSVCQQILVRCDIAGRQAPGFIAFHRCCTFPMQYSGGIFVLFRRVPSRAVVSPSATRKPKSEETAQSRKKHCRNGHHFLSTADDLRFLLFLRCSVTKMGNPPIFRAEA